MAARSTATDSFSLSTTQRSFLRRNGPILVLYTLIVVLIIIGATNSETFLTPRNLGNVSRQAAFIGIVSLGQMIVILTAGIDLSVGSLVKLCVLVSAILMDGNPENVPMAITLTLGVGLLIGFIHAFLINELNIAPFVVTLASYIMLRGVALTVSTTPVGKASRDFLLTYDKKIGPVPVITIFFAILLIAFFFILQRTRFGKYIYAIGGNLEVAHLSGVPVKLVRYGAYMLCSLLASVTGLLWLMRMGVGDPVIGDGLELHAITAVIMGGTSLFGGRGSVIGMLGGVLILTISANLLVMLGVSQFVQGFIQGVIIVAAVALYKQDDRK
jgi:ribose/xylose/arabinose/galactoside ABC-type transport system permease subunit